MSRAPSPRDAVITGIGLVTARGLGRAAHIGCLQTPPWPPSPISLFDASEMPVQVAFQVGRLRPQPFMIRRKDLKLMSRDARLALQAAGLALTDAGLTPMDGGSWHIAPESVGLFMGVGLEPGDIVELGPVIADASDGESVDLRRLGAVSIDLIPPLSALKTLPNMALAHVSINLGLMGPGEALSPWGPSGIQALGVASEAIARGECDMALVGACDSDVDLGGVSTHFRMGVLASLLAQDVAEGLPEDPGGLILGEGAAFFVLEAREVALARGASILGTLRGTEAAMCGAPSFPDYNPEGLAVVLAPLLEGLEGPVALTATSGHKRAWQAAEVRALEGISESASLQIVRPSDWVGSCVAAAGIVDLAVALASDERGEHPLVGAAWGPSGEWAAALVEREGVS